MKRNMYRLEAINHRTGKTEFMRTWATNAEEVEKAFKRLHPFSEVLYVMEVTAETLRVKK